MLPHDLHEKHAVDVLKRGKHLFLEKPMGRNIEVRAHMFLAQPCNRAHPHHPTPTLALTPACLHLHWPTMPVKIPSQQLGWYGAQFVRITLLGNSALKPKSMNSL